MSLWFQGRLYRIGIGGLYHIFFNKILKLKKITSRKNLIRQRNSLSLREKTKLSSEICSQILSHFLFKTSQTIAIYKSINNEVDLSKVISRDKNFLMPVILVNNSMEFKQYNQNSKMVENKFGILEPTSSKSIKSKHIDLCLLPLVGFNRKGDRLGMGGGYYDRYFEFNKKQTKPTILAGIAYDFQENDTILNQSWDIPLDIIFTNKEVIKP